MSKREYPLLAALLALCLAVATAPAFAQDSWSNLDDAFPTGIAWDRPAAVHVDTENNGATEWDSTYALTSVQGVTPAAIVIDRWGFSAVPVAGPVFYTRPAPRLQGLYDFDFNITGPPFASLKYTAPVGPTTPPDAAPLDCNWYLANGTGDLITTDISENSITVGRFLDCLPGTSGAWAAGCIQECAGRVPYIVSGYGPSIYGPSVEVDRAQMAVFMSRALMLPTADYEGFFPDDVPESHWAWPWIEAMKRAGLVGGFDPTHYGPDYIVLRDAMAVFVARGMVGGMAVPSGPPDPTFYQDVPTSNWAYDEIEYCAANNVVGGYGGGYYHPEYAVTRDQMAVFVYRGFIQPTGAVVILAGPAVTAVDADTAAYDAWTRVVIKTFLDPDAYIALDALRLDPGLAPLDVKFELRDAATPTVPATGDYTDTVTFTATDITNAKTAAEASGNPYLYAIWNIPASLEEGDYLLVVSINGEDRLLGQAGPFTIGPIPPPPPPEEVVLYPTTGQLVRAGTYVSGSYSDLTADDENYVVVNSAPGGRCGIQWTCVTTLTPDDILKAKLEVIIKESVVDGSAMNIMTSGSAGATRWVASIDTFPEANVEYSATWESANKAKMADMFQRAGRVDILICGCPDGMTGGYYTTSFDFVKLTFTLK